MNPMGMMNANRFVIPLLIAVLGLMLAGQIAGQTFTTLHSFTGNDGANPYAGLVLLGNTLYGTTYLGGGSSNGTVFNVNTDGTGFTNLHSFSVLSGPSSTNADGANPHGGLVLSGKTLYGTANRGGAFGKGTVFAVKTDGSDFTNLYSFTGATDGANPDAGLALHDHANTLFGTTTGGGSFGNGAVFAVNTDGTGLTNLYSFTTLSAPSGHWYTNTDGAKPRAGLILSSNTLYGTASRGGWYDCGTVFALNTDGKFRTLYNFTGFLSDGNYPYGKLVLLSNILFGTTSSGGNGEGGTVFAVNTDGTGFITLYSFSTAYVPLPPRTNNTGNYSWAGLVLSQNVLYGTAVEGGSSGAGTVFTLYTDGSGFTNLHSLTAVSDGSSPYGGLIASGNKLYGTAYGGGSLGYGTVFSLSFAPRLAIIPSGENVILTWPTNYAGFDYTGFTLQSTTNLLLPVWTTNSPSPVVVNGQNTVTNPSGTQQFYRLSR